MTTVNSLEIIINNSSRTRSLFLCNNVEQISLGFNIRSVFLCNVTSLFSRVSVVGIVGILRCKHRNRITFIDSSGSIIIHQVSSHEAYA